MHIVFGVVRHIEAEDVRQALNIQPARRDIAGNQQPDFAVLEALQRFGALRLRHVAMQRRRIETVAGQRALQDIDIALAIAEDQRVFDVLAADQAAQRLALIFRGDDHQRLLDQRGRRGRRRHGDRDGLVEESVGQAADLRRHRGREEQRLPGFRQQTDDAFDIGDEPHIEHPVGLVDDQDAHIRQQDLAALEQVEHPARRGDQHIDAAVEFLQLIAKAFAADQQRGREPVMLAVALEGGLDLGRQFAGRLQDQRARHARPRPAGGELVDHRQGKAGCLAGAGLGTAEHVAPTGHDGDGLLLDRGGGGVACIRDRLKKFRR